MATDNVALQTPRTAKGPGQRLLIDTSRMTVRRVSKHETSIMSALQSLAASERATLSALVDTLQLKKRKRTRGAESISQ